MPPTARAAGTAAAPVITWARTFPAVPAQVREARRFLAGLLDGGPAAGDALICLSELASNAVVHSRSSQPGGTFTVRVPRRPAAAGGGLRSGRPLALPRSGQFRRAGRPRVTHRRPTRLPLGLRGTQPHRLDRLVRAGNRPLSTATYRMAESIMRTPQRTAQHE